MTTNGVNSNVISKSFAVIRAFTDEQKEWGVNELARHLDIPVSSLHRILKILKSENILDLSDNRKYKIGSEMIRIASIVSSTVDIKSMAKPFMRRLSNTINESVYLALYHQHYKKMSFIESVHSSNNALQYVLELGILHPLTIAASGKVILAHLSEKEIDIIFKEEQISPENQEKLRSEIKRIREQGYAFTRNERKIGAFGAGAPIFDASQKVIGSIICVIPNKNYEESRIPFIIENIQSEANNISDSLGFNPKT